MPAIEAPFASAIFASRRQRAERHARDVDRDVELERLLREARAEHGLRLALLAVALDHEAGERAGEEDELVPVRHRLEDREAAHPVAAELGLHVDVVDDLRREDPAAAEDVLARRGGLVRPGFLVGAGASPSSEVSGTRPAFAQRARGCRSCRAPCRRRTSGTRAASRARRSGTCARSARCPRPSTRRGRSRSRATSPSLRRRSSRRTSSRRGPGPRRRR